MAFVKVKEINNNAVVGLMISKGVISMEGLVYESEKVMVIEKVCLQVTIVTKRKLL